MHCNASLVQERKYYLKGLMLLDSDSNVTMLDDKNLINEIKSSNRNTKEGTNGEGRREAVPSCEVPSVP